MSSMNLNRRYLMFIVLNLVAINAFFTWFFTHNFCAVMCKSDKSCISTILQKNGVVSLRELTKTLQTRNTSREAVFFTETSGTGFIKPRFMCAVESAARAYPDADIYLLMVYTSGELREIENEALLSVLRHHSNVQALQVDLDLVFKDTPLQDFHSRKLLEKSKFLAVHTSDVLRLLVLWLYGGKYFDLDIITVRNLMNIKNFLIQDAPDSNANFANGAFAFERKSKVLGDMLDILSKTFNATSRADNGPRIVTQAILKYTNSESVKNIKNYKEFIKLPFETLFPIKDSELWRYYDESYSVQTMKKINKVKNLFGVHISNSNTNSSIVNIGSDQPFSLLAMKYCPRSYWSAYQEF